MIGVSLPRHTLFEGIACIAVLKYWMLGTDTPGAEVSGDVCALQVLVHQCVMSMWVRENAQPCLCNALMDRRLKRAQKGAATPKRTNQMEAEVKQWVRAG